MWARAGWPRSQAEGGEGRRAGCGTAVIPAALERGCRDCSALMPVVFVPIVTQQPGTAALGDSSGPQEGAEGM